MKIAANPKMINACKIRGKPMNTKIPQSVIKIYANSFPLCQVPNFGSTELQKVSKIVIKSFCVVILRPGASPKKGQKKIPFSVCILGSLKRCKLLRVSWLQPSYQLELLHEYGLGRAKIQENEDQLRRQAHICDLSILERKLELRL